MKVGIICDLEYSKCHNIRQFYFALTNLYGVLRVVKSKEDLEGIDTLFIGDSHYPEHRTVFMQEGFIDTCNANKIKVVVFITERIFDSFFAHNPQRYADIKQFKYLVHFTVDVDDCEKLGTKLHRSLFSRFYKDFIEVPEKLNKVVFIGKVNGECYSERKHTLKEISKQIEIDIIPPKFESWRDYMNTLAKYRFVFSPIGNANAFNFRFYEALLVKAIPIHQVRINTLKYYDIEAGFGDCIYFETIKDLPFKIKNCNLAQSYSEFWFEDYLKTIL